MKVALDKHAFKPEKAHREDAGYDIRTPKSFMVRAHSSYVLDTGVHIEIPEGYVGFIKSKSGLNVKHGLQCEGVIDSGYTGSIVAKIYNSSEYDYSFNYGDKVTQLVILPIYNLDEELEVVDKVGDNVGDKRGDNGFGSTGR